MRRSLALAVILAMVSACGQDARGPDASRASGKALPRLHSAVPVMKAIWGTLDASRPPAGGDGPKLTGVWVSPSRVVVRIAASDARQLTELGGRLIESPALSARRVGSPQFEERLRRDGTHELTIRLPLHAWMSRPAAPQPMHECGADHIFVRAAQASGLAQLFASSTGRPLRIETTPDQDEYVWIRPLLYEWGTRDQIRRLVQTIEQSPITVIGLAMLGDQSRRLSIQTAAVERSP